MIRNALLVGSLLAALGCSGATTETAQFNGRWRKYEDPKRTFVEFQGGQITLGDDDGSKSGTFSFQLADDEEPLYDVQANFQPGGAKHFQLYYERDTISLMGLGDELDGLYEINFESDPFPAR